VRRNQIKRAFVPLSTVNRLALRILLPFLLAVALPALGAATNTKVDLLLDHEVAAPGQTIVAAVRLKMPEGWHTYWKNPGDSGKATAINWQLPAGMTAGDIEWPVPEKYESEGFFTYVFHDELLLRVPITISPEVALGPTAIRATVDWLECKELCLPGKAEVSASLTIARDPRQSVAAGLIESWMKRLPVTDQELVVAARWADENTAADQRQLILEASLPNADAITDFIPFIDPGVEIGAISEVEVDPNGSTTIQKSVVRFGDADWPATVSGILITAPGSAVPAHQFTAAIAAGGLAAMIASEDPATSSQAPTAATSLLLMLLYAFIGGLILNIMPCVLPVIALKILGFVQQSQQSPARGRMLGLIFGAGVLGSFLVLAGMILALKATGQAVGWGMQFQNPQFVLLMTVLVLVVALNFFGLFEFTFGSRAVNAAGRASGTQGPLGAFFNGVLATLLGTPCTAPFLAPALGFALVQPASVIIPMFLAIGSGLAFPYVLLCFQPAWLKFLPKPGAWMDTFKKAMGFPLLATALWLYTVAFPRFGEEGALWFGLFLVLIALAIWIWGQFIQLRRGRRGVTVTVLVLVLGIAYFYVLEGQLQWRAPARTATTPGVMESGGIRWEPWSHAAIAAAQAAGRPVFVDFTARWCPNCIVNKKTSVEIESVRRNVEEYNVLMLRADYTDNDDRITAELERFQRSAIPMNLVYSPNPDEPPQLLPPTLTPGIVLEALEKAANSSRTPAGSR
jgi:thiol:disulfide interchange protein